MLTLDAVRAAVLAPQPWTRLDELVRAELAAGRLVKQVHAEMKGMAEAVWNTPGITEDGEDAFGDTLDALIGHCARQSAYQNPPVLPSEEEVAALPRWARVALAARCARRVLPLFSRRPSSDAPADSEATLNRAVWLCEDAAAGGGIPDAPTEVAAVVCAVYVGDAVFNADRNRQRATEVITAAHEVFRKLRHLSDESADPQPALLALVRNTATTIGNAVAVSAETYPAADLLARRVIRRDFDQLARVASYQQWDDDTPVSPDVFGPRWPEGPPPGWRADPGIPPRTGIELDLLVGERVRDEVAEDEAVNLFHALSRYHLARTGRPLVLDDLRPYLPIRAAVGV